MRNWLVWWRRLREQAAWRERYARHLRSDVWARLRRAALQRAGWRCTWVTRTGRRCTATTNLEVHHLHYRTFERETLQDVQVLCHRHHQIADRQRASANAPRVQRRRRAA